MAIKTRGLKNVDIPRKIIALQCSWIRRLYDDSFHEWKLIPLYLIEKSFGTSFKFHSDLLFKSNKTKFFPSFYREIMYNWKSHLTMVAEISSCILSQYLWYNKSIQLDKASVHFLTFSEKGLNYKNSQIFRNFLVTIVPSKNGTISRLYSRKMEIYYQRKL